MELKASSLDIAFVSNSLRAALSEWYAWLSDKSMKKEEWRAVPHWCKQVPSRLDIPWAIHDLEKHKSRKQLIRALFVVVDEVYLSCAEMENVPPIDKLRNHLLEWHEAEYE
jgi:hypothetical protein|tara:strand:+ start:1222 stop:1554 length:333 start_codon:yes stop_codon:yes gene_type:complete